jgi:hypothetical protein
VQDPTTPAGHVVAVRAAGGDARSAGSVRLERGPLAVSVVIQDLPIDELPGGTRLRLGVTAIVEVTPATSAAGARNLSLGEEPGLLEAGAEKPVTATVLEAGFVEPGDEVSIEAVSVPLTDVLDLHSFRPGEAPKVVTAYLDEARRAGFGEVRIIHGRGRGVQRTAVHRLLASTPGVAAFADAPPARGGWGATVVRLDPPEDTSAS